MDLALKSWSKSIKFQKFNPCSSPAYHSCSGDEVCTPIADATDSSFRCVSAVVPFGTIKRSDLEIDEQQLGYCEDTGGYGIRFNTHCIIILEVYSHEQVNSALCALKVNSKWDLAQFDSTNSVKYNRLLLALQRRNATQQFLTSNIAIRSSNSNLILNYNFKNLNESESDPAYDYIVCEDREVTHVAIT